MRFLPDENLYVPIAQRLTDRGHEALSILEQGKIGTRKESAWTNQHS
jgi:hypothetical protein